MTVINFAQIEFQSVFHLSSRKFKIQAIPNLFAFRKSYELSFMKKRNGYKLCTQSSFNQFFVYRLSRKFIILAIPNVLAHGRKFKILAFPNVLAQRKLYELGFTKKRNGHKLCAKSHAKLSFDRFFMHYLGNSKYWLFPTYYAMGSRTSIVSRKNASVINFAQSRTLSRVSIDFWSAVLEIQNIGHSQRIRPWEVIRARFR
ncbi:hypothetical protein BHE74_00025590 [Ensete ventricosum]|nr:hypothetical protein BHE74_00025590 [Ensete ventricosum]